MPARRGVDGAERLQASSGREHCAICAHILHDLSGSAVALSSRNCRHLRPPTTCCHPGRKGHRLFLSLICSWALVPNPREWVWWTRARTPLLMVYQLFLSDNDCAGIRRPVCTEVQRIDSCRLIRNQHCTPDRRSSAYTVVGNFLAVRHDGSVWLRIMPLLRGPVL